MVKFIITFVALIASAHCIPLHGGAVNTGESAISRADDGLGNYQFGYNEDHATGGTFRKEKGGPGVQVGSYGLRDADGRVRVVNYVADALGFRASVSTNEPGVDPKQDPAATNLNIGGGHAIAPAPLLAAAPLAHAPAPLALAPAPLALAPAPLAHGAPLLAHAEPIAHAPIATSYSVATQHLSAAPVLASHGPALLPAGHGPELLAGGHGLPALPAGHW